MVPCRQAVTPYMYLGTAVCANNLELTHIHWVNVEVTYFLPTWTTGLQCQKWSWFMKNGGSDISYISTLEIYNCHLYYAFFLGGKECLREFPSFFDIVTKVFPLLLTVKASLLDVEFSQWGSFVSLVPGKELRVLNLLLRKDFNGKIQGE